MKQGVQLYILSYNIVVYILCIKYSFEFLKADTSYVHIRQRTLLKKT